MLIFSSATAGPAHSQDSCSDHFPARSRHVDHLRVGHLKELRYALPLLMRVLSGKALGGVAVLLLCFTSVILSANVQATIFPHSPAVSAAFASIKLSEVLSNPQKDWDNDGDAGTANQWIELANTSASPVDISHLELLSHGSNGNQPVLLSATAQIGPSGFFVIFVDQVSTTGAGVFRLFPGGQQLDLIDGDTGATLDSVAYPALSLDFSYSRSAGGVWEITGTPTPGAPNVITTSGSPTPRPTATPRSGKGGGSGGGGSGGHATPTTTSTPIPVGSVVIPDGSALASQQGNSGTEANGSGATSSSFPAWLRIALLAALGAGLLVVIVWYIRSWSQGPEGER